MYNGGKYSLYGYRRYTDIRLVMAPDFQIAATGWDWDNFTYPRYELDFMFYRAYDEDGNPIKTDHYFKWSKKGAEEGEPVFVVGRPGSTQRLISVAELEYLRDFRYPQLLTIFNGVYDAYTVLYEKYKNTDRQSVLLNSVMGWGNSRKSFAGQLSGLRDKFIMAKKMDFEQKLKDAVESDPELKEKYGHVWKSIGEVISEMRTYSNESMALRTFSWAKPYYFTVAENIVKYAEQMKLPESSRLEEYVGENLEATKEAILVADPDVELDNLLLKAQIQYVIDVLGENHAFVQELYGGNKADDAVRYILDKSVLTNDESILTLIEKNPDEILAGDDPFIKFVLHAADKLPALNNRMRELNNTLEVLNPLLGEIVFEVYGTKISPDATSTLRLADGTIKGYEYNGTLAPGKTTYYGLWDRFNSFSKETYPWGLHERWKTPPADLDLTVPICFASTNDIVGGNSGSSVININREVVGLVHDGNMESLPGHFIYLPVNNRSVATDSWGLMESLIYVFKTERLVQELKSGKIE
ncbi:MAG: S46 family peptidase [Melioribacteraceae bacterium]|nr:S46 family peptidase [Melioribacteraceae bacterium]MCF8263731.1 S46 family peptidase [Melioribacteraceae bacterium]